MTVLPGTPMATLAGAPFAGLDAIIGSGGLVVLAPHPDDESLGCGALLRAAACAGRRATVVVVTDGCRSHPNSPSVDADTLARCRSLEVRAAVAALHPSIAVVELGYHDREAPTCQPEADIAAGAIAALIDATAATALVGPWHGDPHVDHAATADLARRVLALRPGVRLWSYPIWGRFAATEDALPARALRFDPAPHRAAKAAAIACHRSQMTPLIDDDPQGFMMSVAMQAHFIDEPEVFLAD